MIELELEYPFDFGSTRRVTSLTFNRLTAKEMRGVKADGGSDQVFKLMAASTGEAEALLEMMDMADFNAASEIIHSFLQRGQKTGQVS